MCGITGFITFEDQTIKDLSKMSSLIKHRGPDDSNYYIYQQRNFYIMHNRLSIIDLNKTGSQPMISNMGNVLVYNGEIYNFIELKNDLIKNYQINFNGTSDTEILLNLIEIYGIEKSLEKIKGMFAFCYFDKSKEKIFFARDRLGEKPLYYGFLNNDFIFVIPEYEDALAKSSCLLILEPVNPNIEAAIKLLTPTAMPIPIIKICGIAKPLSLKINRSLFS